MAIPFWFNWFCIAWLAIIVIFIAWRSKNRSSPENTVNKKNGILAFFAILIGLVLGAAIGGFIAAVLGFALLAAALTLTHTSGDQATGAGGLIILAIPFGLIIGSCIGVNQAMKYVAPSNKQ